MQAALYQFLSHYQQLNRRNLHLLEKMYSHDVAFEDPAQKIAGRAALTHYFEQLYDNVDAVTFVYQSTQIQGVQAWVQWTLELRHPRLNRGEKYSFEGASHLVFNSQGQVTHHRDYFDLGAMLYERLPVIGGLVRFVKRRLG
nr:nuclear transport factor 2 family protein [Gallaecimonas mangrovi]